MRIPARRKLIVGGVAALGVLGGGAALAATQLDSPSARSQAIINDAAKQLGVQPNALSNALKKAIEDQIDAAVSAGQLSKAQGDAIKARIESGDFPLFGGGPGPGLRHGFGFGLFGSLDTAATYLGVTQSDLRSELMSGKTLAQIAKDKGKPVDGLVSALVDAAKKRIDQAVTDGKLTKDQATQLELGLQQEITDIVNGTRPSMPGEGFHGGFRGSFGFGGDRMRGPMGIWRGQGSPATAGAGTFDF